MAFNDLSFLKTNKAFILKDALAGVAPILNSSVCTVTTDASIVEGSEWVIQMLTGDGAVKFTTDGAATDFDELGSEAKLGTVGVVLGGYKINDKMIGKLGGEDKIKPSIIQKLTLDTKAGIEKTLFETIVKNETGYTAVDKSTETITYDMISEALSGAGVIDYTKYTIYISAEQRGQIERLKDAQKNPIFKQLVGVAEVPGQIGNIYGVKVAINPFVTESDGVYSNYLIPDAALDVMLNNADILLDYKYDKDTRINYFYSKFIMGSEIKTGTKAFVLKIKK